MLTLRHFLFYMGLACAAGAIIGVASGLMEWSTGLVYAVGLSTGTLIVIAALRESLFAPVERPNRPRHSRHA